MKTIIKTIRPRNTDKSNLSTLEAHKNLQKYWGELKSTNKSSKTLFDLELAREVVGGEVKVQVVQVHQHIETDEVLVGAGGVLAVGRAELPLVVVAGIEHFVGHVVEVPVFGGQVGHLEKKIRMKKE